MGSCACPPFLLFNIFTGLTQFLELNPRPVSVPRLNPPRDAFLVSHPPARTPHSSQPDHHYVRLGRGKPSLPPGWQGYLEYESPWTGGWRRWDLMSIVSAVWLSCRRYSDTERGLVGGISPVWSLGLWSILSIRTGRAWVIGLREGKSSSTVVWLELYRDQGIPPTIPNAPSMGLYRYIDQPHIIVQNHNRVTLPVRFFAVSLIQLGWR